MTYGDATHIYKKKARPCYGCGDARKDRKDRETDGQIEGKDQFALQKIKKLI